MVDLLSLVDFFQVYGYVAVFVVLLACGFGLPIPEDITLVAGGVISGLGYADVHIMFVVAMVGVLIGDGIMFTVGHFFGPRVLQFKPVQKLITPERYALVQEKFAKYGQWVIFVARFMPGLRSPVFVIAGVSRKISYLKFFAIDGFAALISVPIWVYLGDFGAHNIGSLLEMVQRFQESLIWIALGAGFVVALVLYVRYRKSIKKKAASSNAAVSEESI